MISLRPWVVLSCLAAILVCIPGLGLSEDENIRINKTGKELKENLDLILKEKPKSLLISYKKKYVGQ